jgi:hypothetical protein
MDDVPLPSNFFPPNFSFVFWKTEIWREKINFAKKVFPLRNYIFFRRFRV